MKWQNKMERIAQIRWCWLQNLKGREHLKDLEKDGNRLTTETNICPYKLYMWALERGRVFVNGVDRVQGQ